MQKQFYDSNSQTLSIGNSQYKIDELKLYKEQIHNYLNQNFSAFLNLKSTNLAKCRNITELENLTFIEFLLQKKDLKEEKCVICLSPFFDEDDGIQSLLQQKIYGLKCQHYFHLECLDNLAKEQHICCPICWQIYGIMIGDQPDGKMNWYVDKRMKCAGYSCGTIVIQYSLSGGIRNGKHFSGTGRTAYLPDCEEGREVLQLLKKAFDRKLIFTVGRSVTTGQDNTTVWNGIHHKTNLSGGSAYFGYPDNTYFSRVKLELASKGVI